MPPPIELHFLIVIKSVRIELDVPMFIQSQIAMTHGVLRLQDELFSILELVLILVGHTIEGLID